MKVSSLKKQRSAVATAYETVGKVIAVGTPIIVETDAGRIGARRAASCLMESTPGDTVLVCITGGNEAYVLAILTRDDDSSPAIISAPGDLNLDLPNGKMRLRASAGLALASPQEISLTAHQISLGAARGEAMLTECLLVGKKLGAQVEALSLFAQTVSSTLGTVYQKMSRFFRKVEGIEQVQAGELDLQARDSLSLHGRHTIMTAEKLVKVDGAQIHLG
jgi:hypothetical protein